MGEAAAAAARRYAWEVVAGQVEDVYRTVLGA
jgi:glycosyltransferase involved in cell wall biosynthesis